MPARHLRDTCGGPVRAAATLRRGARRPDGETPDILVYADYVWPAAAYGIAVNSGLEDAYRDLAVPGQVAVPNYALPASTFVTSGTATIPIRSTGDATRTVWLAPSGTTSFAAGPTMARAGGTATSIAAPTSSGEYRLYVVDAQGNRSAESKWIVRQQGGSSGGQQNVMIAGGASGRCIDIGGTSPANGAQAQLWDCNGGSNQRFTNTSGKQLQVFGTKCLDASNRGTTNGTAVVIWDCNGQSNQQWNLNANGTITGVQSGLCLYANGAGTVNGTRLILWSCNGGANQQWSLRN
ncbi:ricin-type beta-trefoil lectin domain protein [Dactylosporangium sp. NPDC005555]|uniref:RICIN domain-containing protein n=1 Tax=Dactylosporangium sp. NPDC005555 TaxID=3154889 RepID=UPI0033A0FD68